MLNNNDSQDKLNEIINILFNNIKYDNDEKLSVNSRKTLLILSQTNYEKIFMIGINILNDLMNDNTVKPQKDLDQINDKLNNITSLFKEIIEKNHDFLLNIKENLYKKYISNFMIFQFRLPNNLEKNEINVIRPKLYIISQIFIHFADIYYEDVLNDIFIFFPKGDIPRSIIFVLLTDLAKYYPIKSTFNCHNCIDYTYQILFKINDEQKRVLICNYLSQISESIIFTIENKQELINNNNDFINKYKIISENLLTIYDIIKKNWLKKIENKNNQNFLLNLISTKQSKIDKKNEELNQILIIKCLIMISTLFSQNNFTINIHDILTLFKNNISKGNHILNEHLCNSFKIYLEFNIFNNKERLSFEIENILNFLFPLIENENISNNVVELDENFFSLKNSILNIFNLLIHNYTKIVLNFLIFKLNTFETLIKITSVYILKTLLIRIENCVPEDYIQLINSIKVLTKEKSYELKWTLFDLIYLLYNKNLINNNLINSNFFIQFLIEQSCYSQDDLENDKKNNIISTYYTNLENVRNKAENTLLDIINKIDINITLNYFYPFIFELYSNSKYILGKFILSKLINIIFEKVQKYNENVNDNNYLSLRIDFNQFPNVPKSHILFLQSFCNLCQPLDRIKLNSYSIYIETLKNIIKLITNNENSNIITIDIDFFIKFQIDNNWFNNEEYFNLIINLFDNSLEIFNYEDENKQEFYKLFLDNIKQNLITYKSIHNEYIVSFLLQAEGIIISKIKEDILNKELDFIFNFIHNEYNNETIDMNIEPSKYSELLQYSMCNAFGLSIKNNNIENIDIVLTKVENMFKSTLKNQKNSSSFGGLFNLNNKNNFLPNHILSSLILILGFIAKYLPPKILVRKLKNNFLNYIEKYFGDKNLKLYCLIAYKNLLSNIINLSSSFIDKKDEIFYLENKDDLIERNLKIFESEKNINIKIEINNMISYLIVLEPIINMEKVKLIIENNFNLIEFDYNNNKILQFKLINSFNLLLQNLFIHNIYYTSLKEINKSINSKSFISLGYKYLIDYNNKEFLTKWDILSYIFEKFVDKYNSIEFIKNNELTNNKEDNKNKEYLINNKEQNIIKTMKILLNNQKSLKFNSDEEFINWCICLNCLIFFINNNKLELFNEIKLFLESLNINIEINNIESLESFNNFFIPKISEYLNEKKFHIFFKMLINSIESKIENISKNITNFIKILINSNKNQFNNAKSENVLSSVELIFQDIENMGKKINNETGKNYLLILYNIANINLDIIFEMFTEKKYINKFPNSLPKIMKFFCNDKIIISNILFKIINIVNSQNFNFNIINILGLILSTNNEIITPIVKKNLPILITSVLLLIGYFYSIVNNNAQNNEEVDNEYKTLKNQIIFTLQQLMKYFDEIELNSCLISEGSIHNKLLKKDEYDEGIYELLTILTKFYTYPFQNEILSYLNKNIENIINNKENNKINDINILKGQKIIFIIIISNFILTSSVLNNKNIDINLIKTWRNNLINNLMKYLNDEEIIIKKMAIRGLGNITQLYNIGCIEIENVLKIYNKNLEINNEIKENGLIQLKENFIYNYFAEDIINILILKLNDKNDDIIYESLNTLQKVIEYLEHNVILNCIGNLIMKINYFFESKNVLIRVNCFILFKRIINIYLNNLNNNENIEKISQLIINQIHNNLINFMLHIFDEKINVKNASFETLLKSLNVLFNEIDFNKIYNDIKENKNIIKNNINDIYEIFVKIIVENLVKKYKENIYLYIKSCMNYNINEQISLRANSLLLLSYFYEFVVVSNDKKLQNDLNVNEILDYFIQLLNDNNEEVRISAIKGIQIFNVNN